MDRKITTLEQLLEQIETTGSRQDHVTLGAILEQIGRRSFGPILLLAGLIVLAPVIGDIPSVPTMMAIVVFLISIQMLFNKKQFWLPDFLLKKSVEKEKITQATEWLKSPARFIDKFLGARLQKLTEGMAVRIITAFCIAIAGIMPVLEFIPFSANAAGVALPAFGLSIITHDGLLALLAFLFTGFAFGLAIYAVL